MPCRPDVLVVPSRLTPFCAPILGTTMAVNPGHLTKGTTGGTYSVMSIDPMKKEKLRTQGESVTHGVQERIKVQIKKI